MLKKVIVTNVNSIGRCEIDLEKGNYKFLNENIKDNVVNPLAIYGHNGSGKTSFFMAIDYLLHLMIDTPNVLIPFIVNDFKYKDYFSGNKDMSLITGKIELYFSVNKNEYEYIIATSSFKEIVEERLKVNQTIVFDRTKTNYKYNDKLSSINLNDSKLIPLLRKLAASEIDNLYIQESFNFITSISVVYTNRINGRHGFATSLRLKESNVLDLLTTKADDVKKIIDKYKDFPSYRIVKEKNININETATTAINAGYFVEFIINGKIRKLPIGFISTGMLNQSVLLSTILSLPKSSVILIDELENALHPSTIQNFLHFAQTRDIQMIFSSHNTNILQSLRPDQIYFAHWKDGVSKFSRLSVIYPNIREVNNIEKMYLSSVFDEVIKKDE